MCLFSHLYVGSCNFRQRSALDPQQDPDRPHRLQQSQGGPGTAHFPGPRALLSLVPLGSRSLAASVWASFVVCGSALPRWECRPRCDSLDQVLTRNRSPKAFTSFHLALSPTEKNQVGRPNMPVAPASAVPRRRRPASQLGSPAWRRRGETPAESRVHGAWVPSEQR